MQPDSMPFAAGSHSSYMGALAAAKSAGERQRHYLVYLGDRRDATDEEAAAKLCCDRSSICSTRNSLIKRGLVVKNGHRMGSCNVNVGTYRLTTPEERALWKAAQQNFSVPSGYPPR